ncbi:MAG: hypothetical protein K2K97_02560, partial [Muribaculaceae bacterium]|nr:hypothetical protein [Muribaculaceae bacterium]
TIDPEIINKLREDGFKDEDIAMFSEMPADTNLLHKIGIANSDAVIFNNRTPDPELMEFAKSLNLPVLLLNPEELETEKYQELYQSLLSNEA